MGDVVQQFWAQLVTFGAIVAAFVRSEMRGRQALAKADAEALARQAAIDKLEARFAAQRAEDREQMHRDYGDLREMMREMQQDIKKLLGKVA